MERTFTEFEHQGWQSIAEKYDTAWSSLTRSYIPALLVAINIRNGVRLVSTSLLKW
jgi:hypothetical protein